MASWWKLIAQQMGFTGTTGSWEKRVAQDQGLAGETIWSEAIATGTGVRGNTGSWNKRLVGTEATALRNPLYTVYNNTGLLDPTVLATEAGDPIQTEDGSDLLVEYG